MKSVLTQLAKFRLSSALDSNGPDASSLQRRVEHSPELRSFAQAMQELHDGLRPEPMRSQAPASFHHSIMRAVRRSAGSLRRTQSFHLLPLGGGKGRGEGACYRRDALAWFRTSRWLFAPALGAILLACFWILLPPPHHSQPLLAASSALDLTAELTQTTPALVIAPLSEELHRVRNDLDDAAQFLLANLP